jgi:SAM-dependent methyltransferase
MDDPSGSDGPASETGVSSHWFEHPLIRSSAAMPRRFWGPERLDPQAWAQFSARLRADEEIGCLLRALSGTTDILDVGGGTGLLTKHIAAPGVLCTVVEPYPGEFSIDRSLAGQVKVIQGRAEALPVASGTFDAVLATWVLQYTDDPSSAINELARACKEQDGARVIIVQAAPANDFVGLYNCVARALGRASAHHGFLLANAAIELERRGFTVSLEQCSVQFQCTDIVPPERVEWLASLARRMHFADEEPSEIHDVLVQRVAAMPAIERGILNDDGVMLHARRRPILP